jgi:putative peptidoglycan lipid II flippase
MSTSVVALFGFVVLFAILRKRIGGVYGRELMAGLSKVVLASLVMGAVVAGSTYLVERWLGISRMARLGDLAISIPLGCAVFYGMCRAMGVGELDLAIGAVVSPLRRRLFGRK